MDPSRQNGGLGPPKEDTNVSSIRKNMVYFRLLGFKGNQFHYWTYFLTILFPGDGFPQMEGLASMKFVSRRPALGLIHSPPQQSEAGSSEVGRRFWPFVNLP